MFVKTAIFVENKLYDSWQNFTFFKTCMTCIDTIEQSKQYQTFCFEDFMTFVRETGSSYLANVMKNNRFGL